MHADGSEPHGDCRNYAWDSSLGAAGGRLVLVSDGGIFARVQPRSGGGNAEWVSLNGDIQEMEYLSAHYDNREDRFVAGAQDNAAQVFPRNAKPTDVATGFVDGDGTVTLVDNVHNPARLYGTTQFLGVGSIDIDPSRRRQRRRRRRRGDDGDGDDDEDCGGLCFAQADNKTGVDKYIGVPLDTYFPNPASFPYFVQPMASKSEIRTHVVVPDRATHMVVLDHAESAPPVYPSCTQSQHTYVQSNGHLKKSLVSLAFFLSAAACTNTVLFLCIDRWTACALFFFAGVELARPDTARVLGKRDFCRATVWLLQV